MFISVLELFKVGIGPSSSHTLGPMIAAADFLKRIMPLLEEESGALRVKCILKGSLAFTGRGHATDRAVMLGLNGYMPERVVALDLDGLVKQLWSKRTIQTESGKKLNFIPPEDIVFDRTEPLMQHPNGMIFELRNMHDDLLCVQTYFSIGGGFIKTEKEMDKLVAPLDMHDTSSCPYPFDSAQSMLDMSEESNLSIAKMKARNEVSFISETELDEGIEGIWQAMKGCVESGLKATGILPGSLSLKRRARDIYQQLLRDEGSTNPIDWLSVYAIAVNEENASGHMVVTAPTNGAAGVIPAVLYYLIKHEKGSESSIKDFLLTAAAIGGLIKHRSSISGAEVGCQGEVGTAASMAAAGLCAVRGGTSRQIENAAEIALEHHLGMTCDPVNGLVQVPCIERNAFGAIKAYSAASLAMRGDGMHFMQLDNCIAAMKTTGMDMSHKYKETALGGLAVSITEC
jgi:L-serine dehydratase